MRSGLNLSKKSGCGCSLQHSSGFMESGGLDLEQTCLLCGCCPSPDTSGDNISRDRIECAQLGYGCPYLLYSASLTTSLCSRVCLAASACAHRYSKVLFAQDIAICCIHHVYIHMLHTCEMYQHRSMFINIPTTLYGGGKHL